MADRRTLRRVVWIALGAAVLLCVAGVFQHGLWTPDEPREAEVGREMLDAHFSAVPTLGGEQFLEKPPLSAWFTAASYAAFGVSPGAARVPSTLFAIGTILVAYFLGKRAAGRVAGMFSAIALATMWQFSETSHKAVLDVALTFFVAAGHLAFLRLRSGRCVTAYVVIGVLSGLAFLTKSWVGPALLCAPPILAWAAMREWETVKRVLPRAFFASVLGVVVLGGPWVLALANTPGAGWAAVKECLWTEYVGRSVGHSEFTKQGHSDHPFWYYAYTGLIVLAPWCLALPAMLKGGTLSRSWRGGRALWCALVFVAGVALLSAPTGKRELYLLPLMPVAAVAVGVWLSRAGSRRGGGWDRLTCNTYRILGWSVLTAAGLGVAYMSRGGHLPKGAAASAAMLDYRAFGYGCVAVGVVALAAAFWVRRVKRISLPPAGRAAWALVVLYAFLHAAVGPLIDPLRDMSAGAREIASLVPADEELLAYSADETTLAVVPFYSGRLVDNVESGGKALRGLETGVSKHLIVMDKDVPRMGQALTSRLVLVKTVRFSSTRGVNVYAYRP